MYVHVALIYIFPTLSSLSSPSSIIPLLSSFLLPSPPLSTHRIVSSITQTFTRHSWRSYTLIKRNSEPSKRAELLALCH